MPPLRHCIADDIALIRATPLIIAAAAIAFIAITPLQLKAEA
jgi:hypothetical protein